MNRPALPPLLRRVLRRPVRNPAAEARERDLQRVTVEDRQIIEPALAFTMTSVPRLQALVDAVRYCVNRDVPGAFAECGVWRGGSVMAMSLTLQALDASDRDLFLYDTFEGMTKPTEADVSMLNVPALQTWEKAHSDQRVPWSHYFNPELFNESSVRETLLAAGHPEERLHFVRGPVEETLPDHAPERLALLRLDTDWYESTLHELRHLYPRLSSGGVLIIDDYGHWDGCRRAVDEYFAHEADPVLLSRIDYTARISIKH
ncbi:MAG: O-methyltransferase [Solirubrobacteraceae bacterium]|jgi:hypothetical protein|nr:O-methyltransferase [Solirubrobacteraceae bacterium]